MRMAGFLLLGVSVLLMSSIAWGSGTARFEPREAGGGDCVACHDGTQALNITARRAGLLHVSGGVTVNHPVGMDYEQYVLDRPSRFRPERELPESVRLVDGLVSCVSCHRQKQVPHASNGCSATGQLTVGPRETDLCLTCHNM